MNDRIKKVRKTLDLSQEEFGKKLGVTKTAVSKMELGNYNITDTMVKLLCREYNVDYMWLTTGVGEMFSDSDTDTISLIDRIMFGENEFAKNVFKMFTKFKKEDWEALHRMINLYSDEANKPSN